MKADIKIFFDLGDMPLILLFSVLSLTVTVITLDRAMLGNFLCHTGSAQVNVSVD